MFWVELSCEIFKNIPVLQLHSANPIQNEELNLDSDVKVIKTPLYTYPCITQQRHYKIKHGRAVPLVVIPTDAKEMLNGVFVIVCIQKAEVIQVSGTLNKEVLNKVIWDYCCRIIFER